MSEAPTVINWLETTLQAYERFYAGRDLSRTTEAFLLKHGKPMGPRIDLPEGIFYGKAKECFGNSFGYAAWDEKYTYCEGFAYTPGLIACHHAWLINEHGQVIDPTWRDGGNDCPFCGGEGEIFFNQCVVCEGDIDECEHDPDEDGFYEGETRACEFCNGTGKSEFEHPSRKGTEYFGIAVEKKLAAKLILAKETYGLLPDCIEDLYSMYTP